MTRHEHTSEQIVRKIRTGEEMLGKGKDLADVLRVLKILGEHVASVASRVRRDAAQDGVTSVSVERRNPVSD